MNKLLATAIAFAIPFSAAQAAVGTAFIAGQHEARAEKKDESLSTVVPVPAAAQNDAFGTARFSYNIRVYKKGSVSGDILNKTFLVLGRKSVKYEAVESIPYISKATSEDNQPLVYEYADFEVKTRIEITPLRFDGSRVFTSFTIETPSSELDLNTQRSGNEVSIDLPSIDTIMRQQSISIPLDKPFNIGGIISPTEDDGKVQVEITVKKI
jgi:hypothetical protein